MPVQVDAVNAFGCGVIHDRNEIRKNWLVQALRESLAFVLILLTMAFNAVSENLMEEYATGPARQDRWPGKRVNDRRSPQRQQIRDHFFDCASNLFIRRQTR